MNQDIIKGVGLIGKALWEVTEGQTGQAILDVISALNLFGVNTRIVQESLVKANGPGPAPTPNNESGPKLF
jgi:hypothetical protein